MSKSDASQPHDKRVSYYEDLLKRPDLHEAEFDPTSCSVLLNLTLTFDAVHDVLGRTLAAHGLSTSAYNVLKILKRSHADGRPLHEIGELLLTSRANVTGLVDCLEAKGLVHRFPDPTDRRSRRACLTAAGAALADQVSPEYFKQMRALVDGLTDADKHTLTRSLIILREHVLRHAGSEPVLTTYPEGGFEDCAEGMSIRAGRTDTFPTAVEGESKQDGG